jgi:predicted CoA-binding protein
MADYSDDLLRSILTDTRVVAAVGVSANPIRPSHFVIRYLSLKGYRMIPVNPALEGETLFGERAYSDIADIPPEIPVDMVEIFRRSEAVPPIVEAAIRHLAALKTVWMQVGVEHPGAAAMAESAGLTVIQNRCPKIERQRLFGELRKAGFNTGVISSRL